MATLSSCTRLSSAGAAATRRQPGRAGAVVTCRRSSASVRTAAAATAAPAAVEQQSKEASLPTWAEFELGRAPVYWKTSNGLPPSPGEGLTLFYNPAAAKMAPNDVFGVAFNGGFNQPIMCGGEPRQMTLQVRGSADPPIYTIRIRVPQHAVSLVFSFTNGAEWDGPYTLKFKVPKPWQNKPLSFFNEGLANELNREGACDRAIYPDENIAITSCAIEGYYEEGGDRCKLDIVSGCMDPSSNLFDPLATVDDGSCPLESDSEE
ncbi:protein POST-ILLUMINATION CHLOROPHYLL FLUORESCENCE INCREASE, chloroplastic-like [Panicum virgatum]|uniref:PIFI-like Ig-like domain-containing protein n=1 Tax=Panicum virgatum TaxID=38727 RepID=A0A8T0NLA7_PANVG|nr:protein POST-ILLUMINATION CHLOROPHYLL FLUORESCENCE INCREASE, chloroplastic-like [Panicum virgatum]KAG2547644.1 hypothetical protein PVAP13_9KG468800 [Panicum virgatum]